MGGWNAGCAERRLSGVGGAGRKPTAERQQGAVLRPHPCDREFLVALRDRSAACAAGPLQFFLCSLLSQRRHCGGAGVKAGALPHPERSGGLGLDTTEPPRSTLRKIQGGRKDRRGTDAGRATPLSVAGGLPGLRRKPRAALRRRHTAPAGAAKRTSRQERERAAKPPPRGSGGPPNAGHAPPAVPRTGATAGAASRVPAVPGAAWPAAPVRWQAAVQAWEERPALACPLAGVLSRPAPAGEYAW